MTECVLCATPGGEVVWQDESCRVVLVGGEEGRDFPGFCRVVWRAHVAEMSDLAATDRRHLMNAVFACEIALRQTLRPDKINLASLGNVVPHLHWHVIPRRRDDSRFPAPVWCPRERAGTVSPAPTFPALRAAFAAALAELQAES